MPPGRPRRFDADAALDRAMGVFWTRGYEGATLDELTAAMGMKRPSLYAAFTSKEELFRRVLERYRAGPIAFVREALDRPTAREVVECVLGGVVAMAADEARPRGCLMVQGALACGAAAEPIRRELAAGRERVVVTLRERFERAARDGDLPEGADCAALARYVATVLHGLAVQAAGGATRAEMGGVVELVMRSWPV